MKKKISIFLTALILLTQLAYCTVYAAENSDIDFATDNTDFAIETAEIIKNADSTSSMLRIIGKFKNKPSDSVFDSADDSVFSDNGRFVLQFSSEEKLLSCLKKLKSDPNIIYAEQDRPIYTEALEEATEYISWGVEAIEADIYSQSVSLPSADSSVTVAIVDSGSKDIDFIKDKLVTGYDFVDNDSDATNDENLDSHGTFLASIVADCTRNLPVKIMPVRVLGSRTGSLINAVNGIIYAVDNGADIINISLVSLVDVLTDCSSLDDALDYAEQNDVTVVVCAGNSQSDIENYCPAHNENALTVTSVNSENEFSESFSNFGNGIDFAAPGERITGYNASGEIITLSGTSLSAAFASAAAAMFRLENPHCNTEQVRHAMVSCAVDCGETGRDIYYGWGVLKLGNLAKSDITFDKNATLKIKKNPGKKTIKYGETLRLTAEVTNKPENTEVWWYINGVKSGEGDTFDVSPKSGSVNITAKLVNANGIPLKDVNRNEISDSESVSVNAGFFQRIISFLKNLFRINRIVIQSVF